MANHTTHIRRVYSRPGWDRSPTHPGKVSTESACARIPRNATRMRFGVVVTPETCQSFLPSSCRWILSNDNLLWLSLAVWYSCLQDAIPSLTEVRGFLAEDL
jgi:hypothetical protein